MAYFEGGAGFISVMFCILALYLVLASAIALAELLGRKPGRKRHRRNRKRISQKPHTGVSY